MARPSKYNWEEIKHAYECGMAIDSIVRKYSVTKKTLENKISSQKWSVMGEVKDAVMGFAESYGRVSGLQEKFPEKAHIIVEEVNEKTRHLKLINDNATKLAGKITTMADQIDTPNDLKTLVEANDRLAITLKVADRHAPKIDIQQLQQNNTTPTVVHILEDKVD